METAVQVAIITAGASIFGASLTFYLTKRAERRDRLQQRKVEHYGELLAVISDLAVEGIDEGDAKERFNRAVNTIVLVAPQSVIQAVMAFHDEASNLNRSRDGHDRRLNELVLAIRKSLELPFADDTKTFKFRLVGRTPTDI